LFAAGNQQMLIDWESRNPAASCKVIAFIDAGYAGQKAFEANARAAVDKLLGG
jgi:hypothetical protein